MIKDFRIPSVTAGQDNMGQCRKLSVSGRCHTEVRKPITDVKGNNITIIGNNALSTTDLEGSVIHHVLVVLNLTSRVNRPMNPMVGVLTKNSNDRSTMCVDLGNSINNLESVEFVIINTSDINLVLMSDGNLGIRTKDTPVCSPINKGATCALLTDFVRVNSVPISSAVVTSLVGRRSQRGLVMHPDVYFICPLSKGLRISRATRDPA